MQIATCMVRLGGLVTNTVFKAEVTPAEVLVLQAIHGQDGVVDVIHTGEVSRSQLDEWDRLTKLYDRSGGPATPDGTGDASICSQLFPGAVKRLPETFKEVGLEDVEMPSPAKQAKGRQAKRPKPAPEVAAADTDGVTFVDGDAEVIIPNNVDAALDEAAATNEEELNALMAAEGLGG